MPFARYLLTLAATTVALGGCGKSITTSPGALVAGTDSLGRTFRVTASASMIDSDAEATVVQSLGNSLRFERSRLLIDGYVAAELTAEMKDFAIAFSEAEVTVTANEQPLVKQTRENPHSRLPGRLEL